ncbi:hypothetical protein [Thiocapsa rosea]|uniref:hypothetical protein n=1 Tax=Thiocapsa rosea TaxID=69360 RepID=UPI0011C43927|nr:hypothetical protein [Thiocapsa rosea]
MAYPPFHRISDGKDTLLGYKFLASSMTPSDRYDRSNDHYIANIDANLLFVQMVGSTLVFLGFFMLLHPGNERDGSSGRGEPAHSGSGQSNKQSEEFFDVGDDGNPYRNVR